MKNVWSLAYNPISVLVTGWDERTTLMLLGDTGCVVHRNSVIFLQLSCKSKTTLNVKVYLKTGPLVWLKHLGGALYWDRRDRREDHKLISDTWNRTRSCTGGIRYQVGSSGGALGRESWAQNKCRSPRQAETMGVGRVTESKSGYQEVKGLGCFLRNIHVYQSHKKKV